MGRAWQLVATPDPNLLGAAIGVVGAFGVGILSARANYKAATDQTARELAAQAESAEQARVARTVAFVQSLQAEVNAMIEATQYIGAAPGAAA